METGTRCSAEARPTLVEPCALGFLDGSPPVRPDGRTIVSVCPSTGIPYQEVPCDGAEEIDAAVEAAVHASALWRGSSNEERRKRLDELAEVILARAHEISRLVAVEQGKPVTEALALEVLPALNHLRFVTRQAAQLQGRPVHAPHPLYAHKMVRDVYDPLGVVAIVTPYPLPFALPMIQIGAALAMGSAVVLKPSELTPCCGLKIAELCEQAGLPAGLVSVVITGREPTLYLVAHPRVDKVFFAGSTETGRQVMATAGCAPRPVVLSLGGKHPSIVASDADVPRAARGVVWGALANAGQNCGAIERVYVDAHVAAGFVDAVLAEVDRVRVGDPLEDGTDMGPLASEQRVEEVHRQVTEAVQAGARLLRGGTPGPGPGFFYPPTVLLDPPPHSRVLREETSGPVIPIVVVDSLERAILLANDSDYALSASGWTTSSETAARMMSGLVAGVVTVNDVLYSFGDPASTWSGHRASGVGSTHGLAGLREMSRRRFVSYDPSRADAPLFAFPYDTEAARVAGATIQAIHGASLLRRLLGALRLLSGRRFRSRRRIGSFLLSILPHGR